MTPGMQLTGATRECHEVRRRNSMPGNAEALAGERQGSSRVVRKVHSFVANVGFAGVGPKAYPHKPQYVVGSAGIADLGSQWLSLTLRVGTPQRIATGRDLINANQRKFMQCLTDVTYRAKASKLARVSRCCDANSLDDCFRTSKCGPSR